MWCYAHCQTPLASSAHPLPSPALHKNPEAFPIPGVRTHMVCGHVITTKDYKADVCEVDKKGTWVP